MAELRKCPFCGGEAKLKHGKPWQQKKGVRIAFVQCRQCEAKSITRFQYAFEAWQDVDHDAINRWNNRATEAEIRAKTEHTYENCHNITCRRKCQKDGYDMAISELLEETEKKVSEFIGINGYLTGEDFRKILLETAEQLKGE